MADFLILDDDKNKSPENLIETQKGSKKSGSLIDRINEILYSFQKVSTKEKAVFYRLMSTMTNSGVGVMKAVGILEKQEKNPVFKNILSKISFELSEGKKLSECIEMFPLDFSDAEIGMIRAGEKTGQLNTTLSDLAIQVEKVDALSGKLKSAMIYPAFIILVVVGVIAIMMVKVVPSLLEIFGEKETLPDSTKMLMNVSDFFVNYWYIMIIVLIFLYIFLYVWKKTPDGKYLYDKVLLKLPLIGGIMTKVILSKFARIFSGLIASGVSVVESLNITSQAVGNEVYKQRVILLGEDISSGIKIHESIEGDKLFPEMMVQMIQVGEQTAKLDETVKKVAEFYDEQVNNTIGAINKIIEPVIIVVLAIIVGLIAMGIMEPIMQIADTVGESG